MMRELLIATTNQHKITEIKAFLEHMPFTFLSLSDLKEQIPEPEEVGETISDNALLKARYYAEKSGMLTLADDTGLFIDALNGWPGMMSARVASTSKVQTNLVLEKMIDVGDDNRAAHFECVTALVDPDSNVEFLAHGITVGKILTQAVQHPNPFGFDPIFYLPEIGKSYTELTTVEKNAVSHRGKALIRIKHHLQNTYVAKHIVVPCGFIIKDGKLLMNLRNDPHRPEYHAKWEFPGGKVEFGESMHGNMVREIKEEVGYEVEIVKMLQHIAVESQMHKTYAYQVFLVPYICRIVGGDGRFSDGEVLESRWFGLDEVLNYDLVGENARMYEALLPELRAFISAHNL